MTGNSHLAYLLGEITREELARRLEEEKATND